MKIHRHSIILELINSLVIETQEELIEELKKRGIEVTQATISRDIKELKLVKTMNNDGRYKYVSLLQGNKPMSNKLLDIISHTLISVECVQNFVVVKTLSGSASAATEALDSLNLEGVAGTIAGDNTIFIMARTSTMAQDLAQKIERMIE